MSSSKINAAISVLKEEKERDYPNIYKISSLMRNLTPNGDLSIPNISDLLIQIYENNNKNKDE